MNIIDRFTDVFFSCIFNCSVNWHYLNVFTHSLLVLQTHKCTTSKQYVKRMNCDWTIYVSLPFYLWRTLIYEYGNHSVTWYISEDHGITSEAITVACYHHLNFNERTWLEIRVYLVNLWLSVERGILMVLMTHRSARPSSTLDTL